MDEHEKTKIAERRRRAKPSVLLELSVLIGVFSLLLVLGFLWRAFSSKSNNPSSSQTLSSAASTSSEPREAEPQTQAASKGVPAVIRKLYIDSPDMEEIIEANLRLEATKYGFQVVPVRSQADIVLKGSAGVFKQGGFLGVCAPFYGFDVVRQAPRRRRKVLFKLESGMPNHLPCIRLEVARQILYDLRERLDAVDAHAGRPIDSAR